jgi:hypothetical protein
MGLEDLKDSVSKLPVHPRRFADMFSQTYAGFKSRLRCQKNFSHSVDLTKDVDEVELKHLWTHDFCLSPEMIMAFQSRGLLDATGNFGIPCTTAFRHSSRVQYCCLSAAFALRDLSHVS